MRKKKPQKENNERWLLTYSDLITLLMIFFIIMYASSTVDAGKYKKISESFKVAFGGGKTLIADNDAIDIKDKASTVDTTVVSKDPQKVSQQEQNKLQEIKKKVDELVQQDNMTGSVSTNIEERGLVISLQDTEIFDTGKADIRSDSQQRLIQIGKIVNQVDNYIRVEGHTDNQPISNYEFKSNWELSSARATNVVQLLISQCGITPQKLAAVGYGEYRPVADNNSDAGRARNRRVDIVIISSKFNSTENNSK
ncbi:MAG: OmpA family protein [Bacillota bacterium]|nr:OmpA family protein [Bacillota bacterium]